MGCPSAAKVERPQHCRSHRRHSASWWVHTVLRKCCSGGAPVGDSLGGKLGSGCGGGSLDLLAWYVEARAVQLVGQRHCQLRVVEVSKGIGGAVAAPIIAWKCRACAAQGWPLHTAALQLVTLRAWPSLVSQRASCCGLRVLCFSRCRG